MPYFVEPARMQLCAARRFVISVSLTTSESPKSWTVTCGLYGRVLHVHVAADRGGAAGGAAERDRGAGPAADEDDDVLDVEAGLQAAGLAGREAADELLRRPERRVA